MEAYRRRTGERMTYYNLAKKTGLARSTIESVATRKGYNASLATIDRLCWALGCQPGELLAYRNPGENAQ
jgi:DNA-binding Xre family transcriptional regulator